MAENEILNFDSTNFIPVNNQNVEEEEELEDRKRREDEIHNFLTNALDDFNYDDESTINSSAASHLELPDDDRSTGKLNNQTAADISTEYREANMNDQIKILYEVRTREVEALNKKVEEVIAELNQREQVAKKQIALLKIENERMNISLREANGLLVDKVEKIKQLEVELDSAKCAATSLEMNIAELKQEKSVLRELNMNFERQLGMMDRGFPLLQNKAEKEALEYQRTKISQLEYSLGEAIEQGQFKDAKIRELKQTMESDVMRLKENEFLIRELTDKLENSNEKIKDLQGMMGELKQMNSTRYTEDTLSEELRRIRLQNETSDNLCETVKRVMSEEFCDKVVALDSENKMLKDTVVEQKNKFEKNENDLRALRKRYEELMKELTVTKDENKALHEKLEVLKHAMTQRSTQTSFCTYDKLRDEEELALAHVKLGELESQIEQIQQENTHLRVKVSLERERDALIKKLQEKAIEFERIIYEKQKPSVVSVGINTTENSQNDISLLKVKYDALLYQTEVDLRKELKKEFDDKLQKIIEQRSNCDECDQFKKELEQLKDCREQDRLAVVNLVKMWEEKFVEAEKENQEKCTTMSSAKDAYNDQINLHISKLQDEYEKEREKTYEQLKKVKTELESRKDKLVGRVNKIRMRIEAGDDEVKALEKRFSDDKVRLERRKRAFNVT